MSIDPAFWSGKRIFLTGHTGFKGSWLSLWLQGLGAEVKGFALAPDSRPNLFDLAGVARGMRSELGDIREPEAVSASMRAFDPEIVFHLAAQPLVRFSYGDPVGTYATNLMGTVHVLEAARALPNLRALICVTTDKVYDNKEWLWGYREDEPIGGRDPYSSSKACAELATAAYRHSFFAEPDTAAVASARAGNVIGGGDWSEDRLVPDILRAFAEGTAVRIRNPDSIRPWQHVLESLGGYLMLAQALWRDGDGYAEGWNFGPRAEDAQPVRVIVERMATLWGAGAHWEAAPGPHPHEAHYLKLDIAKAGARLGWQPRWSLEQALARIVAWHKAWLNGEDMAAHCLRDIQDYSHVSAV